MISNTHAMPPKGILPARAAALFESLEQVHDDIRSSLEKGSSPPDVWQPSKYVVWYGGPGVLHGLMCLEIEPHCDASLHNHKGI